MSLMYIPPSGMVPCQGKESNIHQQSYELCCLEFFKGSSAKKTERRCVCFRGALVLSIHLLVLSIHLGCSAGSLLVRRYQPQNVTILSNIMVLNGGD